MADQKISQLTEKQTLVGNDIITILDSENNNTNKKAKISAIPIPDKVTTMYVDAVNGNNNNDGTVSYPLKTIKKAITNGAELILVYPNTIATAFENFSVANINHPITIMLATITDTYSSATPEQKIYVSGNVSPYHGVRFQNCKGVSLYDFYVTNIGRHGIFFDNCGYGECTRCIVDTNSTADFSGFRADNTDTKYINCIARNITLDGFNFHNYGDSILINCKAYNCGDDGVSHHNGCTGVIIGGEFYNCGKGGISSPTYGAKVDVIDSYSHDNTQYGLFADGGASATYSQATCNVYNSIFENNTTTDVYTKNCKLFFYNTYYKTKSIVNDNTVFVEKQLGQIVDTTSTSPLTLKDNTLYKLGTISSLVISNFIDSTRESEIQFTADTGFTFTATGFAGKWVGGTPTFEAGKSYVIVVKNGLGAWGEIS